VQVTPPLASSLCNRQPVFGVSPLLPRPWLRWFQVFRSPRILPPSWPSDRFPASPRFFDLPVIPAGGSSSRLDSLRPSALPCLNLRVAPFPRSSGNASDRFSPGFPPGKSGFPDPLDLPVVPNLAPRVAPDRCSLRLPRWLAFRVAPNRSSFGSAAAASPGCPGPCSSAAGSMMTPRFDSNFASAACAVDESSSQSGLAHPRLALLMHSPNSILIFHSPGCPDSLPT